MRFQDALENSRLLVKSLWTGVGLLFVSNLALVGTLLHEQSVLKVYVPPEIPQSGITMTVNTVPKSTVYSFAFWAWQGVNDWQKNGADDYADSIKRFSPYLTPRFQAFLKQDANTRYGNAEIQDRMRTLSGMNGAAFSPDDVEYLGHGTWLVHLDMRLTERMNTDGSVVKDAEIGYVLKVVTYNVDASQNHYGLAIDGFEQDPKRIKTFT